MGVHVRVDAQTGKTFEIRPDGREIPANPAVSDFIGPKIAPKSGLRADPAARVRRLNRHLPNSTSD